MVQPVNVLDGMTPAVLRQAKEELRRAQSSLTQNQYRTYFRINLSPQPISRSSVLFQAAPVPAARQTRILSSTHVLNITLHMVNPSFNLCAACASLCTMQVPSIVSSIDFFPVLAITRMVDHQITHQNSFITQCFITFRTNPTSILSYLTSITA